MEITTLVLRRKSYPQWHLVFCEQKLMQRGMLPGASIFDRISCLFRELCQEGRAASSLLPAAMPGSWMVNNQVVSPQFQQWLQPEYRGVWDELVGRLQIDAHQWLALSADDRSQVQRLMERLHTPEYGIVGLSKVLAQLCPDVVPLMDNAALWFALNAVPYPPDAQQATRKVQVFLPMLDWFAENAVACWDTLEALAASHELADYSPAQILDRLLWFESWGYHIFPQAPFWRWVADEEREAILPMQSSPDAAPSSRIDLALLPDSPWRDDAREFLREIFAETQEP